MKTLMDIFDGIIDDFDVETFIDRCGKGEVTGKEAAQCLKKMWTRYKKLLKDYDDHLLPLSKNIKEIQEGLRKKNEDF